MRAMMTMWSQGKPPLHPDVRHSPSQTHSPIIIEDVVDDERDDVIDLTLVESQGSHDLENKQQSGLLSPGSSVAANKHHPIHVHDVEQGRDEKDTVTLLSPFSLRSYATDHQQFSDNNKRHSPRTYSGLVGSEMEPLNVEEQQHQPTMNQPIYVESLESMDDCMEVTATTRAAEPRSMQLQESVSFSRGKMQITLNDHHKVREPINNQGSGGASPISDRFIDNNSGININQSMLQPARFSQTHSSPNNARRDSFSFAEKGNRQQQRDNPRTRKDQEEPPSLTKVYSNVLDDETRDSTRLEHEHASGYSKSLLGPQERFEIKYPRAMALRQSKSKDSTAGSVASTDPRGSGSRVDLDNASEAASKGALTPDEPQSANEHINAAGRSSAQRRQIPSVRAPEGIEILSPVSSPQAEEGDGSKTLWTRPSGPVKVDSTPTTTLRVDNDFKAREAMANERRHVLQAPTTLRVDDDSIARETMTNERRHALQAHTSLREDDYFKAREAAMANERRHALQERRNALEQRRRSPRRVEATAVEGQQTTRTLWQRPTSISPKRSLPLRELASAKEEKERRESPNQAWRQDSMGFTYPVESEAEEGKNTESLQEARFRTLRPAPLLVPKPEVANDKIEEENEGSVKSQITDRRLRVLEKAKKLLSSPKSKEIAEKNKIRQAAGRTKSQSSSPEPEEEKNTDIYANPDTKNTESALPGNGSGRTLDGTVRITSAEPELPGNGSGGALDDTDSPDKNGDKDPTPEKKADNNGNDVVQSNENVPVDASESMNKEELEPTKQPDKTIGFGSSNEREKKTGPRSDPHGKRVNEILEEKLSVQSQASAEEGSLQVAQRTDSRHNIEGLDSADADFYQKLSQEILQSMGSEVENNDEAKAPSTNEKDTANSPNNGSDDSKKSDIKPTSVPTVGSDDSAVPSSPKQLHDMRSSSHSTDHMIAVLPEGAMLSSRYSQMLSSQDVSERKGELLWSEQSPPLQKTSQQTDSGLEESPPLQKTSQQTDSWSEQTPLPETSRRTDSQSPEAGSAPKGTVKSQRENAFERLRVTLMELDVDDDSFAERRQSRDVNDAEKERGVLSMDPIFSDYSQELVYSGSSATDGGSDAGLAKDTSLDLVAESKYQSNQSFEHSEIPDKHAPELQKKSAETPKVSPPRAGVVRFGFPDSENSNVMAPDMTPIHRNGAQLQKASTLVHRNGSRHFNTADHAHPTRAKNDGDNESDNERDTETREDTDSKISLVSYLGSDDSDLETNFESTTVPMLVKMLDKGCAWLEGTNCGFEAPSLLKESKSRTASNTSAGGLLPNSTISSRNLRKKAPLVNRYTVKQTTAKIGKGKDPAERGTEKSGTFPAAEANNQVPIKTDSNRPAGPTAEVSKKVRPAGPAAEASKKVKESSEIQDIRATASAGTERVNNPRPATDDSNSYGFQGAFDVHQDEEKNIEKVKHLPKITQSSSTQNIADEAGTPVEEDPVHCEQKEREYEEDHKTNEERGITSTTDKVPVPIIVYSGSDTDSGLNLLGLNGFGSRLLKSQKKSPSIRASNMADEAGTLVEEDPVHNWEQKERKYEEKHKTKEESDISTTDKVPVPIIVYSGSETDSASNLLILDGHGSRLPKSKKTSPICASNMADEAGTPVEEDPIHWEQKEREYEENHKTNEESDVSSTTDKVPVPIIVYSKSESDSASNLLILDGSGSRLPKSKETSSSIRASNSEKDNLVSILENSRFSGYFHGAEDPPVEQKGQGLAAHVHAYVETDRVGPDPTPEDSRISELFGFEENDSSDGSVDQPLPRDEPGDRTDEDFGDGGNNSASETSEQDGAGANDPLQHHCSSRLDAGSGSHESGLEYLGNPSRDPIGRRSLARLKEPPGTLSSLSDSKSFDGIVNRLPSSRSWESMSGQKKKSLDPEEITCKSPSEGSCHRATAMENENLSPKSSRSDKAYEPPSQYTRQLIDRESASPKTGNASSRVEQVGETRKAHTKPSRRLYGEAFSGSNDGESGLHRRTNRERLRDQRKMLTNNSKINQGSWEYSNSNASGLYGEAFPGSKDGEFGLHRRTNRESSRDRREMVTNNSKIDQGSWEYSNSNSNPSGLYGEAFSESNDGESGLHRRTNRENSRDRREMLTNNSKINKGSWEYSNGNPSAKNDRPRDASGSLHEEKRKVGRNAGGPESSPRSRRASPPKKPADSPPDARRKTTAKDQPLIDTEMFMNLTEEERLAALELAEQLRHRAEKLKRRQKKRDKRLK